MKKNGKNNGSRGSFRELADRFKGNFLITASLFLLLFPSSPSVLCIAPGSHVAIEDMTAPCCAPSGISAQSGRHPDAGFDGAENCNSCQDFLLMSNGQGLLLQSNKLITTNPLADECLETLLSANISLLLCLPVAIASADVPALTYLPVPLRC
jgi:hypothetical protein